MEMAFVGAELRPEYKKKLLKIMQGKHLSRKEFDKVNYPPLIRKGTSRLES